MPTEPEAVRSAAFANPRKIAWRCRDTAFFGEPILLGEESYSRRRLMDRTLWGEMKYVPESSRPPAVLYAF